MNKPETTMRTALTALLALTEEWLFNIEVSEGWCRSLVEIEADGDMPAAMIQAREALKMADTKTETTEDIVVRRCHECAEAANRIERLRSHLAEIATYQDGINPEIRDIANIAVEALKNER
jgi:hypothetical protein